METIRVLARDKKAEISFQTKINVSPVESIQSIATSIIFQYIESWQNWLKQIDALSYALPKKEHTYIERFMEFSKSLESILFGSFSISFSHETIWVLDKEFMELPVEILKTKSSQIFYRNIRSTLIPPANRIGKDFLFVENHYDADSLLAELKREREEITELWDLKKSTYRELIGASCTRTRFIEKITSAKVLHYSGHSFEDGLWFIEDSHLGISDISSLNLSNLKLVSLNSCSSAIGLARGFLEAGAKECVGFLGPVRNDISRSAGTIFWEWYLKSGSASLSAQRVREDLQVLHGEGYPAAYQFVHFGIPEKEKLFFTNKRNILVSLLVLFLIIFLFYFSKNYYKTSEPIINKVEGELNSPIPERGKKDWEAHKDSKNHIETHSKNVPKKEKIIDHKKIYSQVEKSSPKNDINNTVVQKYIYNDSSDSRVEKYISALNSNKLKIMIRRYLQKEDPLVSMEKKSEKIEKILESTESEELIEYKLRELE